MLRSHTADRQARTVADSGCHAEQPPISGNKNVGLGCKPKRPSWNVCFGIKFRKIIRSEESPPLSADGKYAEQGGFFPPLFSLHKSDADRRGQTNAPGKWRTMKHHQALPVRSLDGTEASEIEHRGGAFPVKEREDGLFKTGPKREEITHDRNPNSTLLERDGAAGR